MKNHRPNDQLGDYTRVPAKTSEDDSSEAPLLQKSAVFSPPSTEDEMKKKNLLTIGIRKEVYEIQTTEKKKELGKWKIIFKIFRYINKMDAFLLILSFLAAAANGFLTAFNLTVLLSPLLTRVIEMETMETRNNTNATIDTSIFTEFSYNYLIIALLNFICGFTQIMASENISRTIMTKIKTAYLSKMLSIEVGWYDKSPEQFVSIVSNDLQKMMVLLDSKITSAVEMLSLLIFGCIAGLIVSWKVALLTLVLMMIAVAVVYSIMQATRTKGKLRQQYNGKCTKIASEVLGNNRTVAAYGGEYKEINRYESVFKEANKYGFKHATLISLGKALNYLQMCICYTVAYYFSVRLFIVGNFVPGDLATILIAQINAVYHSAVMLSTLSDIFMATDSAYKVMEFLECENSYDKSTNQCFVPDVFKAQVSFRSVKFSYPTNLNSKVLNNLTLDIEPGKITAVVGKSGTGKSTIVGLISGLYEASAGQILIGGVDIRKLNASWLRNQIGVVGQEPMLFDTTIEENIRYGKTNATLEEIIEAAKISYAHDFIEKLPSGYGSIIGERGIKLSVGEKQRIAIARAIVKKPKLLLLDEATSALDSHSEGIVQEALDNAMRDRTTLVIAHRMSTVRKADLIYAMKEGQIVEKGSHDELMDLKGYYYSLVKIQESEETDKVVKLKLGNVHNEELIKENIPISEDNREMAQKEKKLRLNKEHLKLISVWFLATLFTILVSAYLPAFFVIFSWLCESYIYTKDKMNQIALINSCFLIGLGIITFFSVLLTGIMSTIGTQIWLKQLRKRAFNKIVSMDISWFDRSGNSPNECLEILTNCPPLIDSVTGERAAQVLIFILSLLLSFIYSFTVSTTITLVNLVIIIIFIIINCLRLKPRAADSRSASLATRSTKVATEYIQSVKTIQTLNCHRYVLNQYEDMLVLSKKEAIVSIVWYAIVYGVSKCLMRLSIATSFLLGANGVANGTIEGIHLVCVGGSLSLTSMLAGPALTLISQYPSARQALKRLRRIAYTKSSLNVMTDEGLKPAIIGNVVFGDVTFSYPTRNQVQVLKKLNLKIEAGKTVALIGDSGCGKSTIISLLERFYLPDEGKIMIDGNDVKDINLRYLRSQMGLVLQEPVLFNMTIKENIIYGLDEEVTMDKVIEAAKVANIHNFIMKLPQAYDTSVGERGSKLSGGQKQRIAIARAVLRNPKILLLDEATSALDTESEKAVQEALENASIGKTTIVIAHRLSTIRNADKIIVLQSGVVIEEGNHEQLMERRGYYFNLLNR